MEIASSLCSLWDHMRHVKGINLFLPSVTTYHRASMYLVFHPASPALSLFMPFLLSPPTPKPSHIPLLPSPSLLSSSCVEIFTRRGSATCRLVCLPLSQCVTQPRRSAAGFNVVRGAELFSRRGGVPSARSPQKRDHTVEAEALNLNMNEAYSHHVDES